MADQPKLNNEQVSEEVSAVERASKCSGARERSEQCGATEWVSGWTSGLSQTSQFREVLNQCNHTVSRERVSKSLSVKDRALKGLFFFHSFIHSFIHRFFNSCIHSLILSFFLFFSRSVVHSIFFPLYRSFNFSFNFFQFFFLYFCCPFNLSFFLSFSSLLSFLLSLSFFLFFSLLLSFLHFNLSQNLTDLFW